MSEWKRVSARTTLLIVLGVLVSLGALGVGGHQLYLFLAQRLERAQIERLKKFQPVVDMAPVAVPTGLPTIGSDDLDSFGYPKQFVDVPAVRSLLKYQMFKDLTGYMEQFQSKFENDHRYEYWAVESAAAFQTPEVGQKELLDLWVAASPNSFAPYLARAQYWYAVAWAHRGLDTIDKVSRENIELMDIEFAMARRDLGRAFRINPNAIAGWHLAIQTEATDGTRANAEAALAHALKICPECFIVRATFSHMQLTPRWGGSYDGMAVFARAAMSQSSNPRLKLLEGFVEEDQVDRILVDKGNMDDALAKIEHACSLGDYANFLMVRARVQWRKNNLDAALADYSRAIEVAPFLAETWFYRARIYYARKDYEAAGYDELAGLRIDPTDHLAREFHEEIIKGVVYDAYDVKIYVDPAAASRELELALELRPGDNDNEVRYVWSVFGTRDPAKVPSIEDARRDAADQPDDLRAHQRLDYLLSRAHLTDQVIPIWDDFLRTHPNAGRAYLERAGDYHHVGRDEDARVDAAKACGLGLNEGCLRQKMLTKR